MARSVAEHQAAVTELLRGRLGGGRSDGRLGGGGSDGGLVETVSLEQASGRVLAQDIAAPLSLPPFDNSQMDGYAVRTADLGKSGAELRVAASIAAGHEAEPLQPGTAAPIMTGAMIPPEADAVVPIEQADPDYFYPVGMGTAGTASTGAATVRLPGGVPAGRYVRPRGSDIAAGDTALNAGTVLGPPQLGLLAALGLAAVVVRRRPVVLLLTTGDEVIQPGQPLTPGRIYDANTAMLAAALAEAGAVVRRGTALTDDVGAFRRTLTAEIDGGTPDVILTSGGISKGAFEVVRQGLQDAQVQFLPVAMQPGGPQAIGTVNGTAFLGFPGNPVSALVSFEMFLRPALTALLGVPAPRQETTARLEQEATSPADKHQVRRGLYRNGTVSLLGGPGSHLLHALAGSNALVHFPAGTSRHPAGEKVAVWLMSQATESSSHD